MQDLIVVGKKYTEGRNQLQYTVDDHKTGSPFFISKRSSYKSVEK